MAMVGPTVVRWSRLPSPGEMAPDYDPGCGVPMAGRSAAVVRLGGPVAGREAQECR
jgi:hypothetical protein